MKKLLLLSVVFGSMALGSCSKEYNCNCDGVLLYAENWEEGQVGFNTAQTACESTTSCNWEAQ